MPPVAFQPTSRHEFVPRRAVIARVTASPRPALVVFHGAAGIGKSTTMGQVADALATAGAEAVWVGLSADDRGDGRFWRRVLTVLSAAGIADGSPMLSALREGGFVDAAQFRSIGVELAALRRPIVIALDDFHLATTPSVEHGLIDLLEAAPQVTLLVATRTAGRLTGPDARARLPIATVGIDDLSFSAAQTRELMSIRFPGLGAAELTAAADAVQREARGWALATMALIEDPHDGASDAPLGARSRANAREFVRVHVDRILQGATPDEHDLLLRTSLVEELSPSLVALLAGDATDADAAMRTLSRLGTPTNRVWDDASGQHWYRHHDLIREELLRRARAQLDPREIAELHARVIDELIDTRPQLAAQVAFDAGDWARFSDIMAITFSDTLHAVGPAGDDRIRRVPRAEVERHLPIRAVSLIFQTMRPRNQMERVVSGLRLLAGPALRDLSSLPGIWGALALGVRMASTRFTGASDQAVELAERTDDSLSALSDAELSRYGATITTVLTQKAATYLYAERFDDADRSLHLVLDDPARPSVPELAHAHALLALSAAWRGRMPQAAAAIEACELTALPVGWRESYFGSGYRIAKGIVLLEAGDAEGARRERDALEPFERDLEAWPLATAVEVLAVEALSGPGEALATLERARARHRRGLPLLPAFQQQLASLRSRLSWHSGTVAPATSRAEPSMAAAYALASRGDWTSVGTIAGGIASASGMLPRRQAAALLLRSAAALHLGDGGLAVAAFLHADRLLAEHGLRVPLRTIGGDDVEQLVALVADHRPGTTVQVAAADAAAASVRTVRALTEAEQRALDAVHRHRTARGAATALHVSTDTVRDHLKSIHRKLGVHSRAEAIRVATELGYLPPDG